MTDYPIQNAAGTPDAGYLPGDDKRHRPPPGGKMRDSLFWELIMPEENLGFQAYLFLNGEGQAGFNVIVWGEAGPQVLEFSQGQIAQAMDLDDFSLNGLTLTQPLLRKTANLSYASEKLRLEFHFTGIHEAFSYRQNPDGLPQWFAQNRFEQTGRVQGFIEFGGRRIQWDRRGHRDRSWGLRDWGMPHHWKWIIAYTPDASRIVNLWIWIARGEWGVAGYVVKDGRLAAVRSATQKTEFDPDMSQRRFSAQIVDVEGGITELTLERFGIVKLPTAGRLPTIIMEAACRATIDGRDGAGQFETHWQSSYLDHLTGANKK